MKKSLLFLMVQVLLSILVLVPPCFGIPLSITDGTYTYGGSTSLISGWVDLYDRGYVPNDQYSINEVPFTVYVDGLDPFRMIQEGDSDVFEDVHPMTNDVDYGEVDPFGRNFSTLSANLYYSAEDYLPGDGGGSNWATAIGCTYTGIDLDLLINYSDGTSGSIYLVASVPGVPVPEPSTMLLVCAGLVSFAGFRKKFKKTQPI